MKVLQNLMELSKIRAYIGFAKRSRQIIYGADDILKSTQSKIILMADNLSLSSAEKLEIFARTKHIDLYKIKSEEMINLTDLNSVKAFAITDKNLAKIIKINLTSGSIMEE